MKIKEIIKMWYQGLTKTDKTIKKLEKSKLTFKDGAYSLIAFSFIISLLSLIGVVLLTIVTGSNFTTMIIEGVYLSLMILISLSLFSVIGLLVFTWLFRKVANRYKGKGKFEKEAGLFGITGVMLFLAMIPQVVGGEILKVYYISTPLISYFLYGLGILISLAYILKIGGITFEILVGMEKLKINKIMWIQGLTIGIIYFIFFLLLGLFSQITGVIIPMM